MSGHHENPNAGQGPVVLDIGGNVGALIVRMPAVMADLEVEIIPTGTDQRGVRAAETAAPPHVAVVGRPTPDGRVVHSLVFSELEEGAYDLYVRPNGPVRLTAKVVGAEVTFADWPAEHLRQVPTQ